MINLEKLIPSYGKLCSSLNIVINIYNYNIYIQVSNINFIALPRITPDTYLGYLRYPLLILLYCIYYFILFLCTLSVTVMQLRN